MQNPTKSTGLNERDAGEGSQLKQARTKSIETLGLATSFSRRDAWRSYSPCCRCLLQRHVIA